MRCLLLPILLAAASLPATAASPAPPAEARLDGLEFVPIKASANKRGRGNAKPELPVEHKPVEVALHFHVGPDGEMTFGCTESHPQPVKHEEGRR